MRRLVCCQLLLVSIIGYGHVVAQLPAPAQTPASAETATPEARTEQVLELFQAGNYEAIYRLFSDKMRAAMPLDKFKGVGNQLAPLGPIVRRDNPRTTTAGETTTVTIPVHFQAAPVDFVLSWNRAREIDGMWFRQPTVRRPQDPGLPFPYKSQQVDFASKAPGVRLAGTLTIPEGLGPFPGVVLISGSGPNNRDEQVSGHRPFLVLADHLTRSGIAVLRYDKRGFMKPLAEFFQATITDFADDAEGALDYLQRHQDLQRAAIGLLGHSEGGLVAPIVAARRSDVRFMVMLGSPGVPGTEVMTLQAAKLAGAAGAAPVAIAANAGYQDKIFAILASEKDDVVARAQIAAALGNGPAAELEAQKDATPWMRSFLFYDPAPMLGKVRCPVLALNGELDLQVVADQNLPAIEAALKKGGNEHFQVVRLPKLNHLLQTATTGGLQEYSAIEETMAPMVLETIARWVRERVAGR